MLPGALLPIVRGSLNGFDTWGPGGLVWGPGIHMVLKGSYWKKGREFISDGPIKVSGLGHPTKAKNKCH